MLYSCYTCQNTSNQMHYGNYHYFCLCLQNKSFENTVGKEQIACNEQFLYSPKCFLPFWRTFCNFQFDENCRLQTLSVWKSLKFVV